MATNVKEKRITPQKRGNAEGVRKIFCAMPFKNNMKNNNFNKKHSENTDTSTSVTLTVTCDLDFTSRSRKLMSLDVAWFLHFLWPLTFTCDLQVMSMLCTCTFVPSIKLVGSIEFELWTIVCRKLKWRHNCVNTHWNLIKFKHKSTKCISKRQTEFHFDRI